MPNRNKILKIVGLAILLMAIAAGIIAWYILTDTYTNTDDRKEKYTVEANAFIKEYQQNDTIANKKYAETIIVVNGIVSEIEPVDSTVNIKMIDTTTDAYINFTFQETSLNEAKALKEGQKVSIKGSCSGGAYSEILETHFITFKRCALNK